MTYFLGHTETLKDLKYGTDTDGLANALFGKLIYYYAWKCFFYAYDFDG